MNVSIPDEHDLAKYPGRLTGWEGCDLNDHVVRWGLLPARRVRLGTPGKRRGLYKAGFARLSNGDIIATPCRSPEKGGDRFGLSIFRSQDEGRTWTEIGETPLYGKEPGLTCLRDDALVLTTEDDSETTTPLWRSEDGGRTWTSCPLAGKRGTVRNIMEEPNGTLTMFKPERFSKESFSNEVWVYRSRDRGMTWQVTEKTEWRVADTTPEEPHVIELPDGRLLAVVRVGGSHVIGGGGTGMARSFSETRDHLLLTESADRGRTWHPCRDFLGYGKVHGWLTPLRDGRLMCNYSSYVLPFGVFAVFSKDMGVTWDVERPVQLAISADLYVGWPTSLQLPDQSILTSYALTAYPNFRDGTNADMSVAEVVHWMP